MSNEEFSDEHEGLTEMVNISDDPIVVRVSHGHRVQKVTVKPNESHLFPEGYCVDVKGAGRQVLKPILTRQSISADMVPRLVRREQAEDARAYFESKAYADEDGLTEVEALEAQLAAAQAKQAVIAKRKKAAKAKGKVVKVAKTEAPPPEVAEEEEGAPNFSKMLKPELQEYAKANDIDPDQTVAELVKALGELDAEE